MTTSIKSTKPIQKPAVTSVPILDVIRERWSPRAFDTRVVEREKLLSVLEAARWAASSSNLQPWRFIVATRENEADFAKMLGVIKEGNQEWAQNAPVLILAVSKMHRDNNGTENRHAIHDTGMALAHLTLQATALDLGVRMMGGFYPEKVREAYNIPAGYEPITALALGYYGDPEMLSEQRRELELATTRSRKPLNEIVFSGDWETPADFVE
jgi:nitroreductase